MKRKIKPQEFGTGMLFAAIITSMILGIPLALLVMLGMFAMGGTLSLMWFLVYDIILGGFIVFLAIHDAFKKKEYIWPKETPLQKLRSYLFEVRK
jgi:type IV secretory pathway VirB3-like protein